MKYPVTPDGRYFVVRGRLWRMARPGLGEAERTSLVGHLMKDHGKEMEEWRGNRFRSKYLPLVRPFSAVPDLLRRVRDAGAPDCRRLFRQAG
ncbi:hypothetical protein ACVWZV_001153 [Bradyrhizobium sp. GM5.1]